MALPAPSTRADEYTAAPRTRGINGAVVLFKTVHQRRHVLIQVRSAACAVMPGFFGTPGGMRDRRDKSAARTAARECREECGVELDAAHLVKFAEGAKVDWFAADLDTA